MSNNLILEGNAVTLRSITLEDAGSEYLSWLNDGEVTSGLETVAVPYTLNMLRDYITNIVADGNAFMFMVIEKKSGRPIGTAKVHNINKKNGTCNLGLMIGDKNSWGRGYGQDAYNTAIEFAFMQLGIRKIWEMAHANNAASLSMCKRAGFVEEGRLKEQVFSEGKYIDKVLLGLFAENWKK